MKYTLSVIALFLTLSLSAQPSPKERAKKIANEMAQVLDLDNKEIKAIYRIQLDRFNESNEIKKQYATQPEVRKEKLNKLASNLPNN
jgi:hypothetical protein